MRVLTGIRASGDIHLGNYLGAIAPAIELAQRTKLEAGQAIESFFFVADLHGLTTNPKAENLKANVHSITAAWLAAGLDPKKTLLWRQSDVKETLELFYVLLTVTSLGLLDRAHSFKDALQKQKVVKGGLYLYPVLMAADILLYDADVVPVGKDQAQHLEMTRDIATFFNEQYGDTLKLPKEMIRENVGTVPGIDGRKMSKSYENGIDLFAPEKDLKKQIMSIVTDSKGLQEPKVAEECLVFQIFRLIAPAESTQEMKSKLEAGGYGYGDAKKKLLELILDNFKDMRSRFTEWKSNPSAIEEVLNDGAARARQVASKVMEKVRERVGI